MEIAVLLQPVSESLPQGEDLRASSEHNSLYFRLKDARSAARAIERANMTKPLDDQAPNPHWNTVIELAPEALLKSKDLEVAAWLTEALFRQQGFAGLADGFALIDGLINNFADLYPSPDEDGITTTLLPLTGLNGESGSGTLIQPIQCIPITNSPIGEKFATWQYLQSSDLARAPNDKARQERLKAGVQPLSKLIAAAESTPKSYYQSLIADLEAATKNYAALCKTLEAKYSSNAPPSSAINKALRQVRQAIQTLAKTHFPSEEKLLNQESTETTSGFTVQEMTENAGLASHTSSLNTAETLKNRAAAIQQLGNLAEFFKRTEPHSPLGFGLERLIRWANTPLPELILELLQDPNARGLYIDLTGVEPPPPPAPPPVSTSAGVAPMLPQDQGWNNASPPPMPMGGGFGGPPFGNLGPGGMPPPPNFGNGF